MNKSQEEINHNWIQKKALKQIIDINKQIGIHNLNLLMEISEHHGVCVDDILDKIIDAIENPDVEYVENDVIDITCPFCKEYGFDSIGLKFHLENSCSVYEETIHPSEEVFEWKK